MKHFTGRDQLSLQQCSKQQKRTTKQSIVTLNYLGEKVAEQLVQYFMKLTQGD